MVDEVGSDVSGVGGLGIGECSWALCVIILVMLFLSLKMINGNFEGCLKENLLGMWGNVESKKSKLSDWRRFYSHKRVKVNNIYLADIWRAQKRYSMV